MGLELSRTWFGAGLKGGGFLFVIGADTFDGTAFRLDSVPQASLHELNITSVRGGLGLGGGIGVSLFFGFNIGTLWEVNGSPTGRDWGVNISLPGEKIGIGSWTKPFVNDIATAAGMMSKMNLDRLGKARTLASLLWSGVVDARGGAASRTAATMVIDVPEAGLAAELSAFMSWGEINIGGRVLK